MSTRTRSLVALTGAVLVAALVGAVPGSSSAAPPAGPSYECSTQASAPAPNPTKIMIAGDSITNASAGDYTWPYWLWRDQIDQNANIEFVGRFKDTIVANTLVQGSRAYLDCDFDQDHEARPGVKLWTGQSNLDAGKFGLGSPATYANHPLLPYYSGYTSWIRGAATTYDPDVIVIFAGANDLLRHNEETIADRSENGLATFVVDKLKDVIDEARLGNPGVDIVLTTVPTGGQQRYALYNAKLPAVVSSKNTADERVVLATIPSWADHSWDGFHPDAVGEVAIAAAIDDALHAANPTLPARPSTLATPDIGPRFPAVVTAAADGDNTIKVDWTLPPGADRARILVRETGAPSWTLKADLVKTTLRQFYPDGTATCDTPCTTYTVAGLSGGTTYEVRVQLGKGHAVAPNIFSNVVPVSVTGPVVLGKVAVPTATAGIHAVKLDWSAMNGATVYDVRWHALGSTTYGTTTAGSPTRTITGLIAGRKYGFQVRARNSSSTGAWSDERQAIPKANTLAAGPKPVLSQLTGLRIKATWAASAGANKYQVQRRVVGGAWVTVATTTTRSVTSGKLVKGKTYEFRIRPYDGDVGGAYSPTARRKVT